MGRVDAFHGGCALPADPRGLAGRRHPDVGQHGVRSGAARRFEQLGRGADRGEHGHLARILQEPPGSLADQEVVIGDDDAQRLSHA
jgi:hypothetical protein